MHPDPEHLPVGTAPQPARPIDHEATRRVRENDVLRELDEVTARAPKPLDVSRRREGPTGSSTE